MRVGFEPTKKRNRKTGSCTHGLRPTRSKSVKCFPVFSIYDSLTLSRHHCLIFLQLSDVNLWHKRTILRLHLFFFFKVWYVCLQFNARWFFRFILRNFFKVDCNRAIGGERKAYMILFTIMFHSIYHRENDLYMLLFSSEITQGSSQFSRRLYMYNRSFK